MGLCSGCSRRMDISTQLNQLRLALSDCQAVAYADLESQMVLAKSAAADVPQERWDQLCETGFALLVGEQGQVARKAMNDSRDIGYAMVLTAHEIAVFVRSPSNAEDAILSVAKPSLTVKDFVNEAQNLLREIAQDD